jgi:hypothetical protein
MGSMALILWSLVDAHGLRKPSSLTPFCSNATQGDGSAAPKYGQRAEQWPGPIDVPMTSDWQPLDTKDKLLAYLDRINEARVQARVR